MRFRSVFFIILLCFVIQVAGCGAGKELKLAKEESEKLKQENDSLNRKIKLLEEDNYKMSESNMKYIEETGALKRRLTDAGLSESQDEANLMACKENLKKISMALKMFANNNKGEFPKKLEKIAPNAKYLEFIPTCPSAVRDTYTTGYEVAANKKNYTVCCWGTNHSKFSLLENNPKYTSRSGMIEKKEDKEKKKDNDE